MLCLDDAVTEYIMDHLLDIRDSYFVSSMHPGMHPCTQVQGHCTPGTDAYLDQHLKLFAPVSERITCREGQFDDILSYCFAPRNTLKFLPCGKDQLLGTFGCSTGFVFIRLLCACSSI